MTVMRCGEYVLKCVFWIFASLSWLCLLFWHFSHSIPLVRLILIDFPGVLDSHLQSPKHLRICPLH